MRAVATFDLAGHAGAGGLKGRSPGELAEARTPPCDSVHASSPPAEEGLTATPAGSVTVVLFTSDSARPSVLALASCGTWTSTENPLALLACGRSGASATVALKGIRLQPSKLGSGSWTSAEATLAPVPASASTDVRSSPVHDVGSVKNGAG